MATPRSTKAPTPHARATRGVAAALTSVMLLLGTTAHGDGGASSPRDPHALQGPMPTPEMRSCDLRATRGYCISMTAQTPGVDAMLQRCDADEGQRIGVCPDDDTLAWCELPTSGTFSAHTVHFDGRGPHAFDRARARAECARLGGRIQFAP